MALKKSTGNPELKAHIEAVAEQLRAARAKAKSEGRAWRDDAAIMETVFELMRLKFEHGGSLRAETLPEKVTGVAVKLRWKVVGPAGPETLQVTRRNVVQLSGAEVAQLVTEYTKRKFPQLSEVTQVNVLLDKQGHKAPVEVGDAFRLVVTFPGPKFEPQRLLRLECVTQELLAWQAGKQERLARAAKEREVAVAAANARKQAAAAKKSEKKVAGKKKPKPAAAAAGRPARRRARPQ